MDAIVPAGSVGGESWPAAGPFCYPLDRVPNLNEFLTNALVAWVRAIARRPKTAMISIGLLTLALLGYAVTHLRINSDNVRMIAENLPVRKNHEAFAALFPNLEHALLVVVDAKTPELARKAAEELTLKLETQTELFNEVYLPGGGDFFERNGLLYRSVDELYEFSDEMARAQPLLAELERDPSIANLAALVQRGLDAAGEQPDDTAQWIAVLDQVGKATIEVYSEYPLAISWEELLIRGSALELRSRRVIIAHPVLDFENVFAAAGALEFIHQIAEELGYIDEQGVSVRVTGNPALNYEEMVGIAWDVGGAGAFCFALVIGVLILALRSWKLVTAAVTALLTGLIWTAAFAAVSVGHLNLVSVTFAVLFIGLGVAFGIHLGMCYADLLRMGIENQEAQLAAVRRVGTSLVLCTVTTAVGFFVFIPTDYRGVAELGLIAGTGMFIILFHTLTIIPALLSSWLAPEPGTRPTGALRFQGKWWSRLDRHGVFVRRGAAIAALAALLLLPNVRFNANVIHMRDPSTESVQAFNDLLSQGGIASPWFVNAVTDDLVSAQKLGTRLSEFETVAQTVTIADYVPDEQEEKREILADIRYFFPPLSRYTRPKAEQPIEEQVSALRELHNFLDRPGAVRGDSPLHESMRLLRVELANFLARIEQDGNVAGALASLESILLSGFPSQMARLRTALDPSEITLADLPAPLVARMMTADGRVRVKIYPRESLIDEMAFSRFVVDVQEVAPQAAGVPINLIEFGRATESSFRQALLSAILAITALLWLLWRRVSDVLLALAPLLLSSTLTCAALVLLDMPFNFANVIVIPLLLGIGVDSGIHLVHRANHLAETDDSLLTTTTARAVLFSALTTAVSFGTLALSSHRGMASLGIVLTIGMFLSIICNLVVLPALIEWRSLRDRQRLLEASVQLSS